MSYLTGDDLARPAKDLPLKVIRDLGHMLHRAQYNSGNWETIAEDLGYEYEQIKHFTTMANVKQEVVPGELMLRDWVQRFHGRTLFVLHSALMKAERLDCVQYLEAEIYKRVVCMELMVCVRHEDCKPTDHICIVTRADSNLLDSLQNVLDQPLPDKYKLLDRGVSWTGTVARELKGRQLMLLRKSDEVRMEQDPTIDSSGLDMLVLDESGSSTVSESSVSASNLRTRQNYSISSSRLRASHTHTITSAHFQQDFRRVERNDPNIQFQGTVSNDHTLDVIRNFPAALGNTSGKISSCEILPHNRNRTDLADDQSGLGQSTSRLVQSSAIQASAGKGSNNLGILSERRELNPNQHKMNISVGDGKINNVNSFMQYNAAEVEERCTSGDHNEVEVDMARNKMDITENYNAQKREDSRVRTMIEWPPTVAVGTDINGKDSDKMNVTDMSREEGVYNDSCKNKFIGIYRDHSEFRDVDEYRDPGEYKDPDVFISSASLTHNENILDENGQYCKEKEDSCEYRDPCEYTDHSEYLDPSENGVRFTSEGFDTRDILNEPAEIRQTPMPDRDIEQETTRVNDVRLISSGFNRREVCNPTSEIRQTSMSDLNADQESTRQNLPEGDDGSNVADYQFAAEDYHDSDDSITIVKRKICSRDLDEYLTKLQPQKQACDIDSEHECNIQYSPGNSNTLSDFDSGPYNTHPECERIADEVDIDHTEEHLDGGDNAFIVDSDQRMHEKTRIYLDFNKFDQSDTDVAMDTFRENGENNEELGMVAEKEEDAMDLTSARVQHRPPGRFVSEIASQPSSTTRDKKMYETLQRGVSCPSDIVYDKSLVFLEEHNMVTIAEVFSPVTEKSKIEDFESACSGEMKSSDSSDSLDSLSSSSSKRHSLPMVSAGQNAKRTRLQRHTFQHGDKVVRFDESFEQKHSRTIPGSPALPPRGRLPPLSSSSAEAFSRRGSSDSRTSIPSEAQGTNATGHTCKIVVGGKSSRPALDGMLADDKLFTHYNTVLCNFPSWSPRETENTIEKTMRDALSSDGFYILWYIRGRKNLVISVSFRGTLVHYRVHTKVLTGKLHYYVTQGKYFDDIMQLLHHYLKYGVRAPSGEGGHSVAPEYRIPLRCPVLVQYERRPAVSV